MQVVSHTYHDGADRLIGQLIKPDASAQSTLVLFSAFEGLSQFSVDYAKRLAQRGYQVFCADMYGEGRTADTIPGCYDLIGPFLADRALVRRRAALALAAAREVAPAKQYGSVGFCFGGMCGLELVRGGADVAATVAMHAVLAKSDLPTQSITGKVCILHGYQDRQVPPESLTDFVQEMQAADCNDWVFTFFGDGKHSFTDPATGSFDAEAEAKMGREYNARIATLAFAQAVDFFCLSFGAR